MVLIDPLSILTSGISKNEAKFSRDVEICCRKFSNDESKANKATSSETSALTNRQQVKEFRKKHRINIKKGNLNYITPVPVQKFEELDKHGVPHWLVENIQNVLKCKIPTPVQMQATPCVMQRQSLVVIAPTGSGKTYAYAVPILALLKSPKKGGCRALVIVPTRELSIQILREFDLLRGSKPFRVILFHKAKSEKQRCDVGLATPLKLVQLLRDQLLNFSNVKHVVLDETDKLLESGFSPQIREIYNYLPENESLQHLFFSATLPENVQDLINTVVPHATRISISNRMSAATTIDQQLHFVTDEQGKLIIFRQMVALGKIKPPTLVFLQSIERAKDLFRELVYDGLFVDVIHAGRTNLERDNIIQAFRERKIWFLICTDLMARGVDFKGVNFVLSWDVPQSATSYIHRIGRTGRAGTKGTAITFFTLEDYPYLAPIINVMKESGCEVPDWLKKLKKSKIAQKSDEKRQVKRRKVHESIKKIKD